MPDYSTLLRSSSQAPSSRTQLSIRHRSGAYQSSLSSPKASTTSRHTVDHHSPNLLRDAEVGHSNGHETASASSQSNGSHFTAIPARSRRSSVVSSQFGQHRSSSHLATSTITATTTKSGDDSLSFKPPLDVSDDTITLPICQPTTTSVVALSTSYFSQFSINIQLLAKQMSSLAHSALTSLRQKRTLFSLSNNSRLLSLPITSDSSNRPSFPKRDFGLERALSPADKLTHKWPRPRSSRSMVPWLYNTNPFSPRSLRGLRGAGDWSQGHMEAVLRDSRGLGVNWVGQWTLHKWCLLASVTTVFLLGLTCLVFTSLTWFAGKFIIHPGWA